MLKIIAINAGSSSLKFKLFLMPSEEVITEGNIERIGLNDSIYSIVVNGEKTKVVLPIKNHTIAVNKLLNDLVEKGIVKDLKEINGVGHRVVQGGSTFKDSAIVNNETIALIDDYGKLAPLHNPANLTGIKAFMEALPNVPHVAVFDTSFHQTMDEVSYMYAIPYEWYEIFKVRKYGAHGTSHRYVSEKVAEVMGKKIEDLKIITCHIGNGASIAAVKHGECVDTSMGFTPLEGIPMGTRSGSIDPAIVSVIANKKGISAEEVVDMLNKKSGYLGISGVSNDSRDLETEAAKGNERAKLALELQQKRIADYIGSYYILMGGVDAIVFTAGIGENSSSTRKGVLDRLKVLGVEIDETKNNTRGKITEITTLTSKVKSFIIPTDEEVMIARDTIRLAKL